MPPVLVRRAARLVGWNVLLIVLGLALIAGTGEIYLRWSTPFMTSVRPVTFVPGVGVLYEPNVEVRVTNHLDFWTVSRTNKWGFLDREPLDPKRTSASCHISVIGDSYVEANEVPIPDKFHVRLEHLAARELPRLDVTTSAFGRRATAQASQLPYYDAYAKRLSPKVLVLVFLPNDFGGSSALIMALRQGWDPDKAPYAYPERTVDGRIKLRMPSPEYRDLPPGWGGYERRLHSKGIDIRQKSWLYRIDLWITEVSYFGTWLHAKAKSLLTDPSWRRRISNAWEEELRRRPYYEPLFQDPSYQDDFTAWALQQFKERAERDNVVLLILSENHMGTHGHGAFDRLNTLAETEGIPVISLYDYIIRQGHSTKDAHWQHDLHWNAVGHQWAAEALLEYLRQHPEVCAR